MKTPYKGESPLFFVLKRGWVNDILVIFPLGKEQRGMGINPSQPTTFASGWTMSLVLSIRQARRITLEQVLEKISIDNLTSCARRHTGNNTFTFNYEKTI